MIKSFVAALIGSVIFLASPALAQECPAGQSAFSPELIEQAHKHNPQDKIYIFEGADYDKLVSIVAPIVSLTVDKFTQFDKNVIVGVGPGANGAIFLFFIKGCMVLTPILPMPEWEKVMKAYGDFQPVFLPGRPA